MRHFNHLDLSSRPDKNVFANGSSSIVEIPGEFYRKHAKRDHRYLMTTADFNFSWDTGPWFVEFFWYWFEGT